MYKLFKINGNTETFPEFGQFHKLSTKFLPFAQKKLGFDKPVSVNLLSDPENAKDPLGKTAYYEPEKMKITLFVDKRHVKDILRSMAHELVHHTQNCRGEFKNGISAGEGYAQKDEHMREMEREAYEKGQMLLRDWEDDIKKREILERKSKKLVKDTYSANNYIHDPKMGLKQENKKMAEPQHKDSETGKVTSCSEAHPTMSHSGWVEKEGGAAVAEDKKPDGDGDGVPPWADKDDDDPKVQENLAVQKEGEEPSSAYKSTWKFKFKDLPLFLKD